MENYAPQKDKYHDDWEMDLDKDDKVKKHRDDSNSVYKKDPWGNIYELINYEE